ncbi:zonular occludens toxin domain-containing protein [Acinetobacter pittii]|uniref:zonular occludens toxin domain-containing protein n=1 Tax=Acinetobacter pittii TaxID=48296 RepID=UPI00148A6977|nr:zonular occludens toxin domain-containing protein [Acinetobacter pittii]
MSFFITLMKRVQDLPVKRLLNISRRLLLFLNEEFDDLRPDDYFKKTTRYNEIVDRINDIHGPQKFELLQPVRTIYTNIKACKIPYTRPLIHDWRDAPDGSVIVIDEIQLVEPYKNKKSEDPMIMDLTIHRHRGLIFISLLKLHVIYILLSKS